MQTHTQTILLLFVLVSFIACNKRSDMATSEEILRKSTQYIFLGHTYKTPNRVDPRLEKIDFSQYKGVWLGGDICSETTQERATIDYVDDLFDLSDEDTHWATGNHDIRNGNIQWITDATERNFFYSNTKDGITIAVMDTNLGHGVGRGSTCEERAEQADFFNTLLDTIQESSHLVILTHWVIWGKVDNSAMKTFTYANACLHTFQFLCEGQPDSRFPAYLYDKILAAEERGVEVIIVSGDGGIYSKKYHFETKEGVDFMISGLYSTLDRSIPLPDSTAINSNPDSVLIFNHDVAERKLTWEFVNLDELAGE